MGLRQRLGRFFVRLSLILIGAGVVISLPDPDTGDVVRAKNAIVALVSVILIGVLLFDTFFYDRYGQ
ncbi:MAG TPA: hypothetical protein VFB38_11405 [Chthonomonadaceae bacterium]|nr:hypothetical protein [Chthonomonadaceae bacterium]